MPPNIAFNYNGALFFPPAPAISVEVRSPAFATDSYAERILALIDTGADGTLLPLSIIERLNLEQVDQARVSGYDQKDSRLKFVYSAHLTVPALQPLIVRVVPMESEDYAIIGRNIINQWRLYLSGPGLAGSIIRE